MKRLFLALIVLALPASARAQTINPFSLINFGSTAVDTNSGNKSAGTLRVVLATDGTNPTTVFKIDLSGTSANGTAILVTGAGGTFPVTGTFWQATQPVSGTVTTTPPANASTNVAQLAGTTTDTNSGSKSAGTLRVVLATDQPALTNKLLVTPDSVALPANQSVNVAQLAGTTTDTNSGTKSAGTLRVVLATDQPALTNKLLVTPDSVALPANQSVNISQMNGVTTSMNAGSPDTGTQRVVVADGVLEGPSGGVVTTASTNCTSVKGSAAQLVGFELYNTTTTAYYLRLYNTASAPTANSATGFIRSIPIPPAAAAGQVGGAILPNGAGVAYATGLGYCITGGSSSTDNTNAAVGIFGAIKYR